MHASNILFLGCGKLGQMVATTLAQNHQVWAVKRNTVGLPDNIHGINADLVAKTPFANLLPPQLDYVFVILSPSQYNDDGYREIFVDGLQHAINQIEKAGLTPKHIFFVSSTSVYHQNDDSWIDESSPTKPTSFSGQRLLQAEALLQQTSIPTTIIRFSGIYGGQRARLLNQVIDGDVSGPDNGPYTNRIHQTDCVGMLLHLFELAEKGDALEPLYIGSDCEPVRLVDIIEWIKSKVACKEASEPKASSRRAGSKRCKNQLIQGCGYRFRYPTFREGYSEMLN